MVFPTQLLLWWLGGEGQLSQRVPQLVTEGRNPATAIAFQVRVMETHLPVSAESRPEQVSAFLSCSVVLYSHK